MTATHILSRWRRVAATGLAPSRWLILLAIAEAGSTGIDSPDLMEMFRVTDNTIRTVCKPWLARGHLIKRISPVQLRDHGRPRYRIFMQASGYEVLGIKPDTIALETTTFSLKQAA